MKISFVLLCVYPILSKISEIIYKENNMSILLFQSPLFPLLCGLYYFVCLTLGGWASSLYFASPLEVGRLLCCFHFCRSFVLVSFVSIRFVPSCGYDPCDHEPYCVHDLFCLVPCFVHNPCVHETSCVHDTCLVLLSVLLMFCRCCWHFDHTLEDWAFSKKKFLLFCWNAEWLS